MLHKQFNQTFPISIVPDEKNLLLVLLKIQAYEIGCIRYFFHTPFPTPRQRLRISEHSISFMLFQLAPHSLRNSRIIANLVQTFLACIS